MFIARMSAADEPAIGSSPAGIFRRFTGSRADLLVPLEFASVRRPIWNMNAWFSTGGAVPAE